MTEGTREQEQEVEGMSPRTAGLAWTLCALELALIACAGVLGILNDYYIWDLTFLFAIVSAALVGGLIASRRPRSPIGWFILGHALCFSLGEFSRQYAIYGVLTEPGSLPLARAMASPPYWIWLPGIILGFALLPLYFPNGRLLSGRWRPVVWVAILAAVVPSVLAAIRPSDDETPGIPNPLGVENLRPLIDVLGSVQVAWLGLAVASAASLVVRFRRSQGEERQQMKWVVYAVVFLAFNLVANVLWQEFLQGLLPVAVNELLGLVALSGVWVTIAVAILKYRLYDIDVIINRTLVYGSLTALLAVVYVGCVVLLQVVLHTLTGQESTLAVVASTLAVAALFNPLRRRVQGFIDRRFYRRKYDAAKTLEAFSAKLRDETDLDALRDDLVGVVKETMQPSQVSLWLRPDTPRKDGTPG